MPSKAQFIGQMQSPTGYFNPAGADANRNANGCSDWLSRDTANGGCYLTPYYHTGQDLLVRTPINMPAYPNGIGHPVYAIADGEIQYITYQGWGTTGCDIIKAAVPGFDPGCDSGQKNNVAVVIKHKLQNGGYFLAIYGHILDYNVQTGHAFENEKGQVIHSIVTKGQVFARVGNWSNGVHLHFGIYPNFDPTHPKYPQKFGLANDTDALKPDWKADGPTLFGLTDPIQWVTTTVPDNYITQQTTFPINQTIMPPSITIPRGGIGVVPWQVQSLQGFSGTIQGNVTISPDLTGSSLRIQSLRDQPKVLGVSQTIPIQSLLYVPDYVPLGTYPAKIQTVTQDTVGTLGSSDSADLTVQVVDSVPSFSETFSTPPTYSNNWTYTSAYYPPVVAYTSGLLQLVARIAGQPSLGTFVSKQSYTGDLDVTFTWKHEGYGVTEVGLVTANTTYPPLAKIQSTNGSSLVFGSGSQDTGSKYSNASYMNRTLVSRLKVTGNQIQFYMDGTLMETMSFTVTGPYALYFNAATAPWMGGNNNSSFYSIAVNSLAPGIPFLSAVYTTGGMMAGKSFNVYAAASALDPANVQAVLYGSPQCIFGCLGTKIRATPSSYVGSFTLQSPGTYQLQLQNSLFGTSNAYNLTVYPRLTASCSPSTNSTPINTTVTFTAAPSGGLAPYSFTWDAAAVGTGNSITTSFANGGYWAGTDLYVTDSLGNQYHSTCGVDVQLGQPTITAVVPLGTPTTGQPFTLGLSGTNFGANLEVWFCQTPGNTACYQQPAGVTVANNGLNGTEAAITGINLSAGNWVVQVRNGSSGSWSNFSDAFTVASVPMPTVNAFVASPSPPLANQNFSGTLWGTNFNTNLQVQFCSTSSGACYQHPSAGVMPINATRAQLTNINLGAGTWAVQARNGSSGTWTNPSSNFTVQLAPSFNFTILNGNKTVQAGQQVSYDLNLMPVNNFSGSVTVFIAGLPSNVSVVNPSLQFMVGQGGVSFSLTLQTTGGTPTGTYPLTLIAQGSGISQFLYPSLTVTSPPPAPLSVSCYLSPNPINLGQGTTLFGNATGGSGGYLYSLNGGAYQSGSSTVVQPNNGGTVPYAVAVKDSSSRMASTSCNLTVQGVAPSGITYTWDNQPTHGVNFSGYVYGNAFTPTSTVWFYGPGCSSGCQQPPAGVTVQSLTTIRIVNVNVGAGSWQVEIRTAYGSARSGSFTVN